MNYSNQANKIIGLVIGITITLSVFASAFLPQLATWSSQLSSVSGTSYSWIVAIIALVVVFGILLYAVKSVKIGK
jgi:succinate dehydrogenase/fumarate reductase cytochrome b subunit